MSEEFTENFDFITEAPPQIDTSAAIKAAAAIAIERKVKSNLKSGKDVSELSKGLEKIQQMTAEAKDRHSKLVRSKQDLQNQIEQKKENDKKEVNEKLQEAAKEAIKKLDAIKRAKENKEKESELEHLLQNLQLQINEFEEHLNIAKEQKKKALEKLKELRHADAQKTILG